MFKEFVAFLKEYGVLGLAIAVVLGGKVNDFVGSLVNDVLTPLILQPALTAANVQDIRQLSAGGILYGKVLGAGLDFLIVALLVFLFAKLVRKQDKVAKV